MNNSYNKKLLDKHINSGMLKLNMDYIVDSDTVNNRDEYDSIYFSQKDYEINKNKIFLITNDDKSIYSISYPKMNLNVTAFHIAFNNLLNVVDKSSNNFHIYEFSNLNVVRFSDIKRQLFKDLKDEIVTISLEYKYLFDLDCDFFVLKNDNNNCRMIVSKEHIKFCNDVEESSIRLNRKQRIALGILDSESGNKFSKKEELVLYPYPRINCSSSFSLERVENKILQLFVGRVNIGLISKRTFQSDETFNIVRVSDDVMKILGVSDTDIIKITYCYTSCHCRVLPISNNDKIIEQNSEPGSEKIFEIENIICLPASVRNELGIVSVKPNISVKVERDMGYIFKKNFNKQILPIILILFSTEIFVNGRELIIKIIIALISLPITMYFNLSNERAICK